MVYGYADVVTEILREPTPLSEGDKVELSDIRAGLAPTTVPGTRKDVVTGAGLQLI